jgi:hypothetical protein
VQVPDSDLYRIRTTLVGRPAVEPDYEEEHPHGVALPALCLRRLQLPHVGCQPDCLGRQRDGDCLAELVRGREGWEIDIDRDGYWNLVGG